MGSTFVNAGTFLVNNLSGSGTGSGSVLVDNSDGSVRLGVTGTMRGAVLMKSQAMLAPVRVCERTLVWVS